MLDMLGHLAVCVLGTLGLCLGYRRLRQFERDIRVSEDSYRRQFSESSAIMLLVDPADGQILDANNAAARFYGYSHSQMRGMRISQLNPLPEQEIRRLMQSVQPEQGRSFEVQHTLADGTHRDVEVCSSLIRLDGRPMLHSIVRDITERKLAEAALRQSEAFGRHVLNSLSANIAVLDSSGVIIAVNGCWQKYAEEMSAAGLPAPHEGSNYLHVCEKAISLMRDESLQTFLCGLQEVLCGHLPSFTCECQLQLPTEHRWYQAKVHPLGGPQAGVVVVHEDISERRRAESQILKLSRVVEQTPASVVITDVKGNIEYVNPAFTRTTGYSAEEVIGQNPRILKSGQMTVEIYRQMWAALSAGGEWRGELQNRKKNGEHFWELATISPLKNDRGEVTHFLAIKEDMTVRKQMEEELRTAARTDKLTGLANRALVCDRLQQAILRRKRMKSYQYAVLFLDCDRFKNINDSLGHEIGDQLLREISRRLRDAVRAGDSLSRTARQHTAARLGGDEFVVLLDGIAGASDAALVAQRLLSVIAQPCQLGEHEIFVTASIGIVTGDSDANSAEELLRDADTAMYEAKVAGRGRHVLFDVAMRERVRFRLNLENDLRKALDAGQFKLEYQPIVSLDTAQIESFEALLRWEHPGRGRVSPADFIPIAEDIGLIIPIGEWVLRQACRQLRQWQLEMGPDAPRSISVNLSRNQLMLPSLAATLQQVLQETGVEPSSLHIEITESAVMRDPELAIRTLREIKAIGVKLDMDDFGTGYSSLACLKQFPIDVLKIDRSFVAQIQHGRDFAALVNAVAQLARNLGISVIAEGIETPEQAMLLQSLDCQFGQGYLFGRPMPPAQVPGFRVAPISLSQAG